MSTEFKHTCFFTGHRIIPSKDKMNIINKIQKLCESLILEKNVSVFITGGALGFDTLAAIEIIRLKRKYSHIKLHIYIPCNNQCIRWNDRDIEIYNRILNQADEVRNITNMPYLPGCMNLRNKAMVNDAYWGISYCTNTKSGTYSTIKYAKDKGRCVYVINEKESSL